MNEILKHKLFDIFTDIHGYATPLSKLLEHLGYKLVNGAYTHPSRKALFIGDYIDRGPEQESTCEIVKAMVLAGSAIALMGNHEYNAICYATYHDGDYLRKHNDRNYKTHKEFLDEYPFGSDKHKDIIEWFKTLPLFFEHEGFRAVHACWDEKHIKYLKTRLNDDNTLNDDFLVQSANKETEDFISLEVVLKGHELTLPNNQVWVDPYGLERKNVRVNWFNKLENPTFKNIAISCPGVNMLPDAPLEDVFFYEDEKPVFFGHYWLRGTPKVQSKYIACLDYSVAKNGKLVAYQWSGEKELSNENFVYID